MYIIKWRKRRPSPSFFVRTGISRYASMEAAVKQRNKWQGLFRDNDYYIEPISR